MKGYLLVIAFMIILVFPLQYFKCLLACVVPNKLFFVPLHLMYLLFFFLAKIIHFSMTFLLLWICLISYISVPKLQAWTFSITNFLNRFLDIANAFTSHSRIPTAKSGCMITTRTHWCSCHLSFSMFHLGYLLLYLHNHVFINYRAYPLYFTSLRDHCCIHLCNV